MTPVSAEWAQTQLRGIERRLHRLLETLDRLLDVSRLSTGRIDLQLEPTNIAEVVREVIDSFEAELAVAQMHPDIDRAGSRDRGLGSAARGTDLPKSVVQCDSVWCGTPHRSGRRCRTRFREARKSAITASALRPISKPKSLSGSNEAAISGVAASALGSGSSVTSAPRWAVASRSRVPSEMGRVSLCCCRGRPAASVGPGPEDPR